VSEEVRVKKPVLLVAALVAVVAAAARRRQAQSDAELLWREATSDASR
jgi:hypothetical protein